MGDAAAGNNSIAAQPRRNGRTSSQIRTLSCEVGLLDRADGSAKWIQDGTECLVGVYGPRQTNVQQEDAEKATISVTYASSSGFPGPRERLLENFLRQTVEGAVILSLHPRTVISITVQELSNNGGVLAAALNATNAALADAGIPMTYTFGAGCCAKNAAKELLVDPDALEEKEALALVIACFAFPQKTVAGGLHNPAILATHAYGSDMQAEDFMRLKNLCQKVSEAAANLFKQSIAAAFR